MDRILHTFVLTVRVHSFDSFCNNNNNNDKIKTKILRKSGDFYRPKQRAVRINVSGYWGVSARHTWAFVVQRGLKPNHKAEKNCCTKSSIRS